MNEHLERELEREFNLQNVSIERDIEQSEDTYTTKVTRWHGNIKQEEERESHIFIDRLYIRFTDETGQVWAVALDPDRIGRVRIDSHTSRSHGLFQEPKRTTRTSHEYELKDPHVIAQHIKSVLNEWREEHPYRPPRTRTHKPDADRQPIRELPMPGRCVE